MEHLGNRLRKEGVITEQQLHNALKRQQQHGGRLGENLISLGYITPEQMEQFFRVRPPLPQSVAETGLDLTFIADLCLKHALFMGEFSLGELAERTKLSLSVVDRALEILRRDKYMEVKGGTGYASTTYTFKVSATGKVYGTELLDLCRYVGPAPVTLDDYQSMVERQTVRSILIAEDTVKQAFSHLIVRDYILRQIGPAMSSGRALFLYGPPGNGKTAIAETVGRLLSETVHIPYALMVGGQIINVYDPVNHVPVPPEPSEEPTDQRWLQVKRPVIITGGEMVLRMLDLDFNPISKYYEASLQLKANNGLFIIDDFGRQQIEPQQLLNRWIVPLDRGIDFMTLHTGMKFSIPFDMLVIFSTNLEPSKLVDEAFLRRIQYKIKIEHPTEEDFRAIFRMVCASNSVPCPDEMLDYIIGHYYRRLNIPFNACHPRDILDHIVVLSRYYHRAPELTRDNIDAAWASYFVQD